MYFVRTHIYVVFFICVCVCKLHWVGEGWCHVWCCIESCILYLCVCVRYVSYTWSVRARVVCGVAEKLSEDVCMYV